MSTELDSVRKEIDTVDSDIKSCFESRMRLAKSVATIKSETNDAIFKPEREREIIEKQTEEVDAEIKSEYTALIKRIMQLSRKYQYKTTMRLRSGLAHTWSDSIPSYDRIVMKKTELYICDMVSKDKIITCDDYEAMGRLIADGSFDAGIGVSEEISRGVNDELHGILTKNDLYINCCKVKEDSGIKKKVVMFSRDFVVREEDNRLKLMFVCPNRDGSLASILSMIADYGVNLTEIHSRPNREESWNYEFFVELAANYRDENIQALIFQLENETQCLKIIGSYECEGDF